MRPPPIARHALFAAPLLLAACAEPSVTALDPVTLANGQKVQGVVTVAADKSGAAPALTMIQSFDVSKEGKTVLLATETGKSAGLATVLAGSVPGAAPALIASTSRGGDVNNTITTSNETVAINETETIAAAGALAANLNANILVNDDDVVSDTNSNVDCTVIPLDPSCPPPPP